MQRSASTFVRILNQSRCGKWQDPHSSVRDLEDQTGSVADGQYGVACSDRQGKNIRSTGSHMEKRSRPTILLFVQTLAIAV